MNLALRQPRRRARPSLTPMIDVVFLLLIFFMLAARFGAEGTLTLALTGGGGAYSGPPRLVSVSSDGLRLNGIEVEDEALADALVRLMEGPDDLVVLRSDEEADTAAIVHVVELLSQAGFSRIAVVE